jgi:leucyl aminopeptidase
MFKSIVPAAAPRSVRILPVSSDRALPASFRSIPAVAEALRTPGFRGEPGETLAVGSKAVLLGIGDASKVSLPIARRIGARLLAAVERMGHAAILLEASADSTAPLDPLHLARGIAEGMAIANWRLEGMHGSARETPAPSGTLRVAGSGRGLDGAIRAGLAFAASLNETRRLQATPPNIAHPGWIAAEAKRLARASSLRCRVISHAEALRLGMGGIATVGRASAHKGCLVILEHRPRRPRGPRLVFVGKTITYDTGGYSLKVNNGMKGMKYDKSGGCAVLGAMRAIAAANLPVPVTALLACAENMVGGDAYRPDDVIRLYNGVTCEVTNTDAEGRLVLADALAWACRHEKPGAIVDLATLTGGVVVALGNICAGYFCSDADLAARLEAAGQAMHERVWRLPLWPEHRELMKSRIADVVNSGAKRGAHPIQGAAFLSWFVDPQIPWAHVDIAGVAEEEGHELFGSGPTGFGTGLLFELARGYAEDATPEVSSPARGRGRTPRRAPKGRSPAR